MFFDIYKTNLFCVYHMLFDHEVDPVQRALKVLFPQIGGEGLKVGGAMFVSPMGSEM